MLVCQTNENNYVAGQEVGMESFYTVPTSVPAFTGETDSTNVYLTTQASSNNYAIMDRLIAEAAGLDAVSS